LAALILSSAGVPNEDIAADYALSKIGIEPRKAFLTASIQKRKPQWTQETPGKREFSNVRMEYMMKFLEDAENTYTGGNWACR
jgi:protein tyrosine/serine phosphatase